MRIVDRRQKSIRDRVGASGRNRHRSRSRAGIDRSSARLALYAFAPNGAGNKEWRKRVDATPLDLLTADAIQKWKLEAFGGDPRRTPLAKHAGKWRAGRLRRIKRRKDSEVHIAVDTLGHLLALKVTPANAQERAQVADLLEDVQEVTGGRVKVAFVDQGYTGEKPAAQAAQHGVQLMVVKLEEAEAQL